MNNKIAIIITTFGRDDLLFKSVESILSYLQTNWKIIIVDQGNPTEEKTEWVNDIRFTKPDLVHYYPVPFNSGLSYCRNFGVEKALMFECDYVLMGSDSFLFNESLCYLDDMTKNVDFDCIGFELNHCKVGWEADLSLDTTGFELNFIDKSEKKDFYKCDIVRNFFLATTASLYTVKWDKNLKLAEHEDFFFRYGKKGYRVGWTDKVDADKMTDRPDEYAKFRKINFEEGLLYLKKKYKTTGWVNYKNLNRAKTT